MRSLIKLVVLFFASVGASSAESRTRHKRAWIIDSFSIEEEHPGPFPYVLGKIHLDRNYRVAFRLHGSGVDEDPKDILHINEDTGIISVKGRVDYEQYPVLRLTFEARNVSNLKLDTKLGVEINVLDINDHPPKFQMDVYETSVEESDIQGTSVITVLAIDHDKPETSNSTFDYRIISVTPNVPNVEFFIEDNGRISFRGCLEYEKADKYSIVVEAKDHGEAVRLSSSCTVIVHVQDKNNHMPTISGRTGTGRVKEGESGISLLRLHVTDKDTKSTAAWRARYMIYGDTGEHFKIDTDPETNDGILTVIKPLDFEEGAERHLSISVENEEPYFSCQVKRKTSTGLWKVTNIKGNSENMAVPAPLSVNITITVDDINDPPEFKFSVTEAMVEENTDIGYPLANCIAVDPDGISIHDLVYVKGDDPGDWVNVDPKTGQITTAKILDRESVHVVNNTYIVTIYAVDNGEPPMTGTGTFTIHLTDQNDNLPLLEVNILDMCLSNEATVASINAYDLDGAPYGSPFKFELLGDVEGKWSLDPNYGTTVNLVKESLVYSGHHELQLKIYDMQGQSSVQNLSVTVCDCSITPNCLLRGATGSRLGGGAIGIMFVALLALLVLLLLALLLSCEKEKIAFPFYPASGDALLPSNIETPGTDCKIPDAFQESQVDKGHVEISKGLYGHNGVFQQTHISQHAGNQNSSYQDFYQNLEGQCCDLHGGNSTYKSMTVHSQSKSNHYKGSMLSSKYSASRHNTFSSRKEALTSLIYQRLGSIQAPGQELCDYDPKQYAYEGDSESDPELDAISIDGNKFDPNELRDLDPRFLKLATLCSPSPTLHSTNTSTC
ncbi:cadherin-like protein 26 [Megalops cyprinoides]|uniref:cadherin-like protein 26 n=1 Tax=Megalops cyprinoides TaxID=118141 RepID=UPI001863C520|nr:cadherin-like protein 26 [Megalops cyprinoides]